MLKTPPLLLLSITTLTLVSSMLGINRAYAQTNTVDSSCASSQFGCFEVGLPGSKKFAAGQNIAAFTDSPAPIRDLVNLFVTFITGILVIVGVITIVIGGYMYMTAGGNASQVSSAKEMITAALIGIFIAFISVVILNTVNPFLGRSAVEPKLGSPQPSSAILNDTSSGETTTLVVAPIAQQLEILPTPIQLLIQLLKLPTYKHKNNQYKTRLINSTPSKLATLRNKLNYKKMKRAFKTSSIECAY
jgi:TM2 domain-containing membrane protein YozV